MNQSTAEKQETKAENQTSGNSDAPPENRKRTLPARFWREVKDSVLELGIFAVGGALIWTGLSADPRFLQKFFFYLDVQSWTTLTKISFVITVLFVLYLIVYAVLVIRDAGWSPAMLLLTIPLVALGIGMVVVLKERIREIKSGEEDDLEKY